jgi:hypothetical protein
MSNVPLIGSLNGEPAPRPVSREGVEYLEKLRKRTPASTMFRTRRSKYASGKEALQSLLTCRLRQGAARGHLHVLVSAGRA